MDLNLEEYDFIDIESVSTVKSPKVEKLYDITVDADDHTFFIVPEGSNDRVLVHNCDGSHITAMLIGWFKRFAPNLFDEGKICKLITPIIVIEDSKGKVIDYFFNVQDFKTWEAKNPHNKNKIKYLKGLGSWERQQLIDLIETNGIDKFLVEYKLDKDGEKYIDDWLGPDPEKRKTYLREYVFDINQA